MSSTFPTLVILGFQCMEKINLYLLENRLLFFILFFFLLLSLALSSGCSYRGGQKSSGSSSSSGGKRQRGTKPYTIKGKTYYPITDATGFRETGIASWYGKDFHGKQTANGERYNMYGMTAAHKILPFETKVKVTNLDNGQSIVVRINDRGPFVTNRVIDLTKTGADKIGMIGPGTARVRVEAIGSVRGQQPDGDIKGDYYIQIGAFQEVRNADRLISRMKNQGFKARKVKLNELWRVQVGPYSSVNSAQNAGRSLSREFPSSFTVGN